MERIKTKKSILSQKWKTDSNEREEETGKEQVRQMLSPTQGQQEKDTDKLGRETKVKGRDTAMKEGFRRRGAERNTAIRKQR